MSKIVDANFTANSIPAQVSLTINIVGQGSVMKVPDKPLYDVGEKVVLYAIAAVGWSFTNWNSTIGFSGTLSPATITI